MADMTPERHEYLRIFFEVQDHTRPGAVEAELWLEIQQLRAELAELREPHDTARWVPPTDVLPSDLVEALDDNPSKKTRYIAKYGVSAYLKLCDLARNEKQSQVDTTPAVE